MSQNFLLFLTSGIFRSKFVLEEIHAAMRYNRHPILVRETDPRHGGTSIYEMEKECERDAGTEVSAFLFGMKRRVVPFERDRDFQTLSIKAILREMLQVHALMSIRLTRHAKLMCILLLACSTRGACTPCRSPLAPSNSSYPTS